MDSRSRLIFAWISVTLVGLLSLGVAYVCFNILQSSAEASLRNYKLSGAIAAFLVTASFLSTTIITFYRILTSQQIDDYRKQIQELQAKIIKGAPCPPGYTIDIDEKHDLVFARPKEWEPREGILYAYVEQSKPNDAMVANFVVTLSSVKDIKSVYDWFDSSDASIDGLYELQMAAVEKETKGGVMSKEFILVDGVRSAKYVNTYTGEFSQGEGKGSVLLPMRQSGILCYIPRLESLYTFTFTDDQTDYLKSSAVFNNVIASIRFL